MGSMLNQDPSSHFSHDDPTSSNPILLINKQTNGHKFNTSLAEVTPKSYQRDTWGMDWLRQIGFCKQVMKTITLLFSIPTLRKTLTILFSIKGSYLNELYHISLVSVGIKVLLTAANGFIFFFFFFFFGGGGGWWFIFISLFHPK